MSKVAANPGSCERGVRSPHRQWSQARQCPLPSVAALAGEEREEQRRQSGTEMTKAVSVPDPPSRGDEGDAEMTPAW